MSEELSEQAGAIGVELADLGTRLAIGLPNAAVSRIERTRRARFEWPPAPDEVIERVSALVTELGVTPTGVGVAVWTRVDPDVGAVLDARYGVRWQGFPLAERLAAHLGAPAWVVAGVNAAAQAEARVGAAAGRSSTLYVHLGRTITSALVVDGEPLVGARHNAGMLGHWQTGLDGPRCVCGAQGHLGPLASAQSLVRMAIGVAADDEEALAAIHRITGMRAEALTAPQLITLARDGVRSLRELVDYALDALAGALANLVVTLDPEMIVIGGPLALADRVALDWLRERLTARLSNVAPSPLLVAAALEPHGALLGAISSGLSQSAPAAAN